MSLLMESPRLKHFRQYLKIRSWQTGRSSKLNGGVDAKIGVTNNMTMDLTINPDFGQVEADPSVVNLTAYETFFTEKRPFFIEGNNITNFRTWYR